MKVDFSLVILGIFIFLMIYFAVFLEIDIEYIFLACFIFAFIVNGRDYKNETSKKEFIIGNSVSSVVGAVILFAIIFGASGFLLDTLHDAKFNEEIDEIGYHNNTVTVDELKLTMAFLIFLSSFNLFSMVLAQLAQSRFLILYLYFIYMFLSNIK